MKRKFISEINITSLADVSITLLVIFLITSPLLQTGFEVNLPKSKKTEELKKEAITITLRKDKKIFVGEEEVEISKLPFYLEILSKKGKKEVFIKADKELSYGFVMEIVGEIKDKGFERVGFLL
ncbi:MAG: biopolymer transporter ExbD, partial [candidate division WOR-3 bacterium]